MRDKWFDKLVEAAAERVILAIQSGVIGVCYRCRCGEPSVFERIEKLEQKNAKTHADIVGCKDCRWWSDKNGGFCDILGLNINDEEFFCAWGEEK